MHVCAFTSMCLCFRASNDEQQHTVTANRTRIGSETKNVSVVPVIAHCVFGVKRTTSHRKIRTTTHIACVFIQTVMFIQYCQRVSATTLTSAVVPFNPIKKSFTNVFTNEIRSFSRKSSRNCCQFTSRIQSKH